MDKGEDCNHSISDGCQPRKRESGSEIKRQDSIAVLASRLNSMWSTAQESTQNDPFLQNMLGEQEDIRMPAPVNSRPPKLVSSSSSLSMLSEEEEADAVNDTLSPNSWEKQAEAEEDLLNTPPGFVIDPDGDMCYMWLGVVTISVLYNLWAVVFRTAFKEDISTHSHWFTLFDWVADVIYLADIAVQFHVGYLEQGILVQDTQKLRNHYRQGPNFFKDIASVFPISFLELALWPFGDVPLVVLRFPRFLKFPSLMKFFDMSDTQTNLPHLVRALRLTLYLTTAIHWIACFYYVISNAEGFGVNDWVYPKLEGEDAVLTRKYIRCLYWSMLTLTAIGETPTPSTNLEYTVTGLTFLVGVMIFAAVVGNVGDVISNMNAARMDFQARMDCIKQYMNHRNVPELLQRRVKKWLDYSWSRTQALDEASLLASLPGQLRTEIAIHVHLDTLKKVDIFANCERGFLRELVVKLRSQIFSPGDYICREGEVGREMYIINHGRVEVIVREQETNQRTVVRTMIEGSYFGEISLLRLDAGCNKRSADVRSVGYSELFILSKRDLLQALHYYPEARELLEKGGRDRLKDHKTHVDASVPNMMMDEEEEFLKPPNQPVAPSAPNTKKSDSHEDLKQVVEQLKHFDSLASKHWMLQLEAKCQSLESKLMRKEDELKGKESEMERLQTSVKEMEKLLAARRERKSRRKSTGSAMIMTNGFLDVASPSKRRTEKKTSASTSVFSNRPGLAFDGAGPRRGSVPSINLTPPCLSPVIELAASRDLATEPPPRQPVILMNVPQVKSDCASSYTNNTYTYRDYANSAVSDFNSDDSDNDISD